LEVVRSAKMTSADSQELPVPQAARDFMCTIAVCEAIICMNAWRRTRDGAQLDALIVFSFSTARQTSSRCANITQSR
jgi:hypothetical protein